jgi:hypothetical protein
MTTPDEPPRRTRGRRGKRKQAVNADGQPCAREGCPRVIRGSHYDTCSFMCHAVRVELAEAERVCVATGDTAHWLTVVEMNDALSEYRASDLRVYHAALDNGVTAEQWRAIKSG